MKGRWLPLLLLCLILARWGLYFAYGYCMFFSLSMFLPRLLPAILLSEVFGVQDYAALYARMNLFFLIGAALGSVLTALLAKLLGYAGAWVVYILLTALFFLCVAAALLTEKGRLPLALRGVRKILRRDAGQPAAPEESRGVPAWKRGLAFVLILLAFGIAVM